MVLDLIEARKTAGQSIWPVPTGTFVSSGAPLVPGGRLSPFFMSFTWRNGTRPLYFRSGEHTSELQSRVDLVCRLLLEKKKRGWVQRGKGEHGLPEYLPVIEQGYA